MRPTTISIIALSLSFSAMGLTAALAAEPDEAAVSPRVLPWREAGLTERQAAAHLLDRFAYGPRPGDIDRVVDLGLEVWFEQQLRGALAEPRLDERLAPLESLALSTTETMARYPNPGMLLREMARAGEVDPQQRSATTDRDAMREQVMSYAREQGYRPQRELIGELYTQKLFRALYGENQLHAVLTDFWFNHFNVSITDNDVRAFVTAYERDAIRPHVTGRFREMLEATAKHPAMLLYLDNARSVAAEGAPVTFDIASLRGRGGRGGRAGRGSRFGAGSRRVGQEQQERRRSQQRDRRPQGLNENYARELMELHTLGVDGGYDQDDVVEVARAFTGWTLVPPRRMMNGGDQRRVDRARRLPPRAGFVFEGPFLFRADAHDAGTKTVLGTRLPAGRGIEDGLAVLDLLATHPSTARHLAGKLAVRFVADEPPAALIDRLAATYTRSGGSLAAMVRTLAYSPSFWDAASRGQKIKSPFELATSALRALDADVVHPRGVLEWIGRIGQPLYAYQAPTGYPDRASHWVNTGALLGRMNFGLQLATGRIPGVVLDLEGLDGGREPASLEEALRTYVPLLVPGRDGDQTVARLLPVVRDPAFAEKLEAEAEEVEPPQVGVAWELGSDRLGRAPTHRGARHQRFERMAARAAETPPSPLAQVVGVILGSPTFQRR